MTATFLTPAFLSAFHPGLQSPELGPIVPLSLPPMSPMSRGPLVPAGEMFLPIATSMCHEVEALKTDSRPTTFGTHGDYYKATMSGLPREVGADPEDARLHWIVSDAVTYEGGVESLTALQKGGASQLKEVRVRRHREAIHVEVTYGALGLQVTHSATVGRKGKGDFQSLSVRLGHEHPEDLAKDLVAGAAIMMTGNVQPAVLFAYREDVERSFVNKPVHYRIPLASEQSANVPPVVDDRGDGPYRTRLEPDRPRPLAGVDIKRRVGLESARTIFIDDLVAARENPIFSLMYSPASPDLFCPAELNATFLCAPGGPTFPKRFVDFVRRIEDKIRCHILQHGGDTDGLRPLIWSDFPVN